MLSRRLRPILERSTKSVLLLGPRQTGKSTLVGSLGRDTWALELKASRNVGPTDLRGLKSFADFHGRAHVPLVLYLGGARRRIEGVDVLPWQEALREMGL